MHRSVQRRRGKESARVCALALTTVLALTVALEGCGSSGVVAPPQATARPAPIVHVPSGRRAGRATALVVALHPSGGDPAGFEQTSGWDRVADEHGFLVAYLGSASPAWKDPANVAYIAAEIRWLVARYGIDPRRVYVTGFSAGAYIAYFVGCRLGSLVAGIAAVSGAMAPRRCQPSRPVSELTLVGTHDIVPLTGTARFPSPATVAARWRALDRCPRRPPRTAVVGPVLERTWSACDQGTAVALYVLRGGRHAYPGAAGLPPSQPDSRYDASEAVWAFFAAYARSAR